VEIPEVVKKAINKQRNYVDDDENMILPGNVLRGLGHP
jgi:hypothetical protein